MSEAKFTRGEWEVKTSKDYSLGCAVHTINEGQYSLNESVANAHLIKTAPKMYEFLESLQLDVSNDYIRDDLLAEARGEK